MLTQPLLDRYNASVAVRSRSKARISPVEPLTVTNITKIHMREALPQRQPYPQPPKVTLQTVMTCRGLRRLAEIRAEFKDSVYSDSTIP